MKKVAVKSGHKNKGIFANLLVFSITCLLCLLLAEAGLRLLAPQKLITRYSKIWRPDNLYGWRHQENLSTLINSGEGTALFVTDDNGFRVNSETENQADSLVSAGDGDDAGAYSLLFIGDSYLEAIQVENHCTIPQVIRKNLAQKIDANIAVTNASCGRWNPNHYYLETQQLAPRQYDLAIIFLYAGNDVVSQKMEKFPPLQLHVHRLRVPGCFSFQEIKAAILYPFNELLESHSHLYMLLKKRTKWLRMKWGLSPYYIPEVVTTRMQTSSCWATTTEICKSIRDEFARFSTPCFFVLIPIDFQTDVRIFDAYVKSLDVDTTLVDLEQPQAILHGLFAASSLSLVDPLEEMRAQVKAGKQLYGFIDSHLNKEGHKALAEYIEPQIKEFLLVK